MKKTHEQKPVWRTTIDITLDANEKLKKIMADFKITKSAAIRKAIYLMTALSDNKISMIDKKGEKIKLIF